MKYLIHWIIIFVSACFIVSCDDMYSIHQKYLDEGEDVYIGYPDIVAANGGYGRVQLVWKLNADPKIDECCIYWNERKDSITVAPNRTDSVMKQIIPLTEGKYILEMVNKSNKGYRSLVKTVSVESYGREYQNSLYNRIVTDQAATPENVTLTWSLEEGCVGVNMKYTNKSNQQKEVFIEGEQTTLVIDDYKPGGSFTYSSLFVPEVGAIDTIPANEVTAQFPSFYILSKEVWEADYHADYADIDRTGWTTDASTEELTGEGAVNGRAATLLDGNLDTFWHSQWSNSAKPPMPHRLDFDMKESKTITSIELARRKSNKDTKKVVFYISEDNTNWTEAGSLSYPNDANPNSKVVMYPNTIKGRYLRLMVTESNNGVNASLSELKLTTTK